jgi:GlcNAc-P-P-Und epimerase
VHQYMGLLEAAPQRIHQGTFYCADYDPVQLREWAECFRAVLAGPPIRRLPRAAAQVMARMGDVLNAVGWRRFPFNSFRLHNVLTASAVPLDATREVCGPLPYSMEDGVRLTAEWLRRMWGQEVPRDAAA